VVQQLGKLAAAAEGEEKKKLTTLQTHVLAQSSFHLQETPTSHQTYQELLPQQEEVTRMQVIVNALAVCAANAVPYVSTTTETETETETETNWQEQAVLLLEPHNDASSNDGGDDVWYDLAYNLGTLQTITLESSSGGAGGHCYYLDQAYTKCQESKDNNDSENEVQHEEEVAPIRTNQTWSKHWRGLGEVSPMDYNSKVGTEAVQLVNKINQALVMGLPKLPTNNPQPKWTALQTRLYWYNRAVMELEGGSDLLEECRQSIHSLRSTLQSPSNTSKTQQKKNAAGKSKSSYLPTASDADTAWWQARVDVLLAHVSCKQDQDKQSVDQGISLLQERLRLLDILNKKSEQTHTTTTMDHATAHVQLHLFHLQQTTAAAAAATAKPPTIQQQIQLLESLPESLQTKKAVVATLTFLSASNTTSNDGHGGVATEKASLSKDAKKKESSAFLADVLFSQGDYANASEMYQRHLPSNSNLAKSNPQEMQQQARRVQALALLQLGGNNNNNNNSDAGTTKSNPQEAQELWQSLKSHLSVTTDDTSDWEPQQELDGDYLEHKELPRLTKSVLDSGLAAGGLAGDDGIANQKSHNAILQRRARKREQYLEAAQAKGDYNPARPTKPNPERWIPKHARSSNRGGRRRAGGDGYHKGAQGGVSERDADRLDAAARKRGDFVDASGPSTASMKVSSGGGRKGSRRR
jgi:hypothetical protein